MYSQLMAPSIQIPSTYFAGQPLAQVGPPSSSSISPSIRISRVVHLRNIPSDMVEMEIVQLCSPHGSISNMLLLKGKNQAFVEFDDESGATSIVRSLETIPIQIRGKTIFAQYSTHTELKTEKKGDANGNNENSSGNLSSTNSTLDISSSTQQSPNCVLRVIIENMLYPVTLEILYNVFSRYGKVLRIITFNKNNTFQALVQLSEANSAQTAKAALENQCIYNGCCTLRIDYSKLSTLNIKYNNDKSRDYTNPNLPAGELTLEQQLSIVYKYSAAASVPGSMPSLLTGNPFLPYSLSTNPVTAFFAHPALTASQQDLSMLAGDALTQSSTLSPYLPTLASLSGLPATVSPMRFQLAQSTPVILVSNLEEQKVNPDDLFTLFGVYGDVLRVKILFNKKDNALIQYSETQQAQLACQHLDKVKWYDRIIRVTPSKHTSVQMPKEGQPDAGLTKDYSHSTLHRFKKPGSKNYLNIYSPSSTLHLSNIPPNVNANTLQDSFKEAGYDVKAFKFFPKDHKMALMQLGDCEEAIDALIKMHNFKLAENAHLRVSFSKSAI
ncbi:ptb-1 [Pristionchus pacificus]|uniref:Ptb-1 n=1 Tax=Pristionchus pacificus TaxID=54126 RepID=A0A2A6BZL2_PRIPA|nr:ptb-1 [Pristionchus pacificus]|eukprot:PDM71213.1 ptb-1 [Pristionchus pacificus]